MLDSLVAALDTARQTLSAALSHACAYAPLAGHIIARSYDPHCCSVLPPMKDLFESEKFESEKFVFRVAGVFTGVCVE